MSEKIKENNLTLSNYPLFSKHAGRSMWCVGPLHCQAWPFRSHAINSVNNSQRLKGHQHKGLVLDATL